MNIDTEFMKELIQTNIELVEDTLKQSQRDYDTSKMWIKQTYNNLFNLLPKEEQDRNVNTLLSQTEINALLEDPFIASDFFKQKYQREIFEDDWEDEEKKHITPPKKHMLKDKTPPHNTQPGFRNKPATNLKISHKKQLQSSNKSKPFKRFF